MTLAPIDVHSLTPHSATPPALLITRTFSILRVIFCFLLFACLIFVPFFCFGEWCQFWLSFWWGGLGCRRVDGGFVLGVVVLICASGICFNYDAFRARNLGIWLGLVLRWIRSRVIVMISFCFVCFGFCSSNRRKRRCLSHTRIWLWIQPIAHNSSHLASPLFKLL